MGGRATIDVDECGPQGPSRYAALLTPIPSPDTRVPYHTVALRETQGARPTHKHPDPPICDSLHLVGKVRCKAAVVSVLDAQDATVQVLTSPRFVLKGENAVPLDFYLNIVHTII